MIVELRLLIVEVKRRSSGGSLLQKSKFNNYHSSINSASPVHRVQGIEETIKKEYPTANHPSPRRHGKEFPIFKWKTVSQKGVASVTEIKPPVRCHVSFEKE